MELQLEPPLPLGGGGEGEARWGGEYFARPAAALCPLANVVLPPSEAREAANPNPNPNPNKQVVAAASHMLLYLNEATFEGEEGAALAEEVRYG